MGLFDILGDMAEFPFKAARVPLKVAKAVDEATLDTGLAKDVDRAVGKPISEVGRAVNDAITELDD